MGCADRAGHGLHVAPREELPTPRAELPPWPVGSAAALVGLGLLRGLQAEGLRSKTPGGAEMGGSGVHGAGGSAAQVGGGGG